jgi:hypothetical protein
MNETEIIKIIFPYTRKECVEDFINLKQTPCDKINLASHIGNKFVNYFTQKERFHTMSSKGFSFLIRFSSLKKYTRRTGFVMLYIDYIPTLMN